MQPGGCGKVDGKKMSAQATPQDFMNDVDSLIQRETKAETSTVFELPLTLTQMADKYKIEQGCELQPPEIVFEMAGIPLLTKKSISLLIAKAKAGKTTVAAWMIAQAIKTNIKVLWIDTETGRYYGSRTQHWILKIAGLETSENLAYYDLKTEGPTIRVKIIEYLLKNDNWGILVVDGIRDLVFDINCPKEATNTATNLMRWADNHDVHVLTILHVNKGDGNARGHLGAEMVNKAETVIKVSLNDSLAIVVEPEFTRSKPFNPFALTRDEDGVPSLIDQFEITKEAKPVDNKNKTLLPNQIAFSTHLEILTKAFKNQPSKKYAELAISLQNEINSWYGWSISNQKSKDYLQYYLDNGMVIKTGLTPHTKYTIKQTDSTGLLD